MVKEAIKFLITGFKYFPSPVTVMVAAFTMASGVVGYHSFIESAPPATFSTSKVSAINDDTFEKTILMYDCNVESSSRVSIKLNRRLMCDDSSQYDLPQSVLTLEPGKSVVSRYIPLPQIHKSGTKCVFSANIEWTPVLSVKPHFYETDKFPFVVDDV